MIEEINVPAIIPEPRFYLIERESRRIDSVNFQEMFVDEDSDAFRLVDEALPILESFPLIDPLASKTIGNQPIES